MSGGGKKERALFKTIYSRTMKVNNLVSDNATTINFTGDDRQLLELQELSCAET
jgi:hypothetical protein